MKAYRINKESNFFGKINDIFELKGRWDKAIPEIGAMLGLPDLKEVASSGTMLGVTREDMERIENGPKLFKYERGFYTPKKNTKQGKAWVAGFQEISARHKLNVQPLGVLMFLHGMNNTRYEKPYDNLRTFRLDGEIYMSWEGDGEPQVSGFDGIESQEYYDALVRFEEQGKNKEAQGK